MSIIERGKLKKLNDTDLASQQPINGQTLVYNETTQKWEPKSMSGAVLGTPSDGAWADGIIAWNPTTKVSDAFDDVNELLAQLAPANADALTNTTLSGGPTVYTAKISAGLSNNWVAGGKNPGDTITTTVKTTKATYATPNTTTCFNYADKGLLKLYINNNLKATIDLETNFSESNRNGSQVITNYNNKGNGDAIIGGVVSFDVGQLKILSVAKYNNFTYWQKGTASVIINTELSEGYNSIHLVHEIPGNNQTMKKYELYFDDDTTAMLFSTTPTVTENSVTGKFLSGVKFYTIGDTFSVRYVVDNAFKKVYHATKVSDYSMPGISTITKNPVSVPNYADQFSINDSSVAINTSNIANVNAKLSATAYDPFGATVSNTSADEGRLILTYGNRSTDVAEYFSDEVYRLPLTFDFTSKNATVKNNWNSANALTNGNAQCYISGSNTTLIYPQTNFTTGILPSNTANYSTFTGNQQYTRAFISNSGPQASVQFTLSGMAGVLGQLGNGDINVEIKLPGLSGWGDALKPYDSTADKTVDGWGMLSGSVSGSTFTATFGGMSTVNSGDRIYVRITYRTKTASINSIVVGW